MLSQGVPMMVMGDEARQTQFGNNNAYCQDNEITWFDWTLEREARGPRPLHQRADRLPQGARHAPPPRFFTGELNERGLADIAWHGCRSSRPAGTIPSRASSPSRWPASPTRLRQGERHRHPRHDEHGLGGPRLRVPTVAGRRWHRAIDTGGAGPNDIFAPGHEPLFEGATCRVRNRSIVVLISKP